ncbi:hypothetical protein LIN78_12250 [Leeia sp. TBRC 13508]|uniref:Uncharacterized protein n=1 Tax=Leeia speluncae TaxID=2884804 RepID=A0ABS8D8P2_9NEIS|nr:hypothetical protein [Leeia speluncae]MCB6184316.1 hypothetical protein [Leeia speluncae]
MKTPFFWLLDIFSRSSQSFIRRDMMVNKVTSYGWLSQTDGMVIAVHEEYAEVRWPRGERTLELVHHLQPIVG